MRIYWLQTSKIMLEVFGILNFMAASPKFVVSFMNVLDALSYPVAHKHLEIHVELQRINSL